jgi:hypothetical protein
MSEYYKIELIKTDHKGNDLPGKKDKFVFRAGTTEWAILANLICLVQREKQKDDLLQKIRRAQDAIGGIVLK